MPSFTTFGNLIRNELMDSMEHTYIDGTKIEANANRYTWVWKKSCIRNRDKIFEKISELIDSMNISILSYLGIKLEKRNEYAIDYITESLEIYKAAIKRDLTTLLN